MNSMNPKVDWFFSKDTKWQKEYEKLKKGLIKKIILIKEPPLPF